MLAVLALYFGRAGTDLLAPAAFLCVRRLRTEVRLPASDDRSGCRYKRREGCWWCPVCCYARVLWLFSSLLLVVTRA